MAHDSQLATAPESASTPLVSGMGSPATQEFIRYFVASLLALLVDTGALYLLTSVLDLPYLYSGAVAFLLGLGIVYALSIFWVFDRRTLGDAKTEAFLFLVIGLIGLGINEALLWLLTDFLGFYYLVSKAGSVVAVFSWNFAARKYALFR